MISPTGIYIGQFQKLSSASSDGLRASQTVSGTTSQLTWDQIGGLPLLLSEGSTSYIYGPEGLPVEQISGETPTYYHHDQLGSTRMLTNSGGEASATFSYSAYGGLSGKTGTQTTPLGYGGQYTSPESGLIYLRARVYDPATGQFLTRDPLGGLTRWPYGYAVDDPLNQADRSGLLTVGLCVSGGIGGFIGINGSACIQGSTSGDVGVTATGGPVASAGTADVSLGPGVEISNANHINQLEGPFVGAGGKAADGIGGYGEGFSNLQSCNEVNGLLVGPAVGAGAQVYAGPTDTVQVSVNLPSVLETVGHGISEVFNAINPFG